MRGAFSWIPPNRKGRQPRSYRSRTGIVPATSAQEVADKLVQAGIKAILNYAPISINVPPEVKVQHTDPVTHLQRMTYYL